MDIPKAYEPHLVEKKWYKYWEENNYFRADADSSKPPQPPFSIVIPPPNVTGSLHIGHALNNTLQDILTRFKRMQGYNTLWLPGTDHAGIATQNVVEKQLRLQGLTRQDLGREKFIERVWEWKKEYGGLIIEQLKRLGTSCDWSRTRFTMDEGLSKAVREVFVSLYEQGFIYRDYYIVNWCPRCHTALADIEVEYKTINGHLDYIKYEGVEKNQFVVVATTRPETMLGDTAVAVNPDDKRYNHLIGKEVILPILNRRLKVIGDSFVEKEFGTGAVKVTPAHDPNDFEIGKRHALQQINILNPDATMNENTGHYQGLDRYECRKKLVEELKAQGLLIKREDYSYAVGHCYRCQTIIEPYLSQQWFVRMKEIAKPAIEAVKDGRLEFIPKNWEKTYFEWMENIRDWCISRQIWWGHQIPVWYCPKCKATIVERQDPTKCPQCGGNELVQDPDVLDTWFSSALWPFSTLGFPEKTKDLAVFYPTSVLSTGFDIIFFWVARMIMMGLKFMGDVPFKQVYIHALIRDAEGQKMSKSHGNVIDPLKVIDKYGTDALRFTLAIMAVQGRDILLAEERIEGYRHFCNKLWNAGRLILTNLNDYIPNPEPRTLNPEYLSLPDRWILTRLNQVIEEVTEGIDSYRFNEAAQILYDFVWHEYCDWYLELAKPELAGERRRLTQDLLLATLNSILRLLHPFMPFITEELWQKLSIAPQNSIMVTSWPTSNAQEIDLESIKTMETIQEVVTAIRTIRTEMRIPPKQKIPTLIIKSEGMLKENSGYLTLLTNINEVIFNPEAIKPDKAVTMVVKGIEFYLPLEGIVDLVEEERRLSQELSKVERDLKLIQVRLANEEFMSRAPEEVVKKERMRLEETTAKRDKLLLNLKYYFH
ncbi:MAG: valine--tRNA ligase [bacterium]|nr:valine--tRNA ligase [bacterium]